MFNVKRLFNYLANGVIPEITVLDEAIARENAVSGISDENMDAMIAFLKGSDYNPFVSKVEANGEDAKPKSLKEHDEQYHPEGFKEGDSCKFRETLENRDKSDVGIKEANKGDKKSIPGISNKKRREYEALMKKKHPELDSDKLLQELGKIKDTKVQGDAFRWVMKGAARIPEDLYKIEKARQMAEKAKVDPMDYNTPQGCIDALSGKVEIKEKPIDPDTVPELSDKKVFPMGVTTYEVQDDQNGQQAMRKILDTHWGKDANPWCLLARSDEDTQDDDFINDFHEWWYYLDLEQQKNILKAEGYSEEDVAGAVEDGDIPLSNIDEQVVENYYIKNIDKSFQAKDNSLRTAWKYWNHYNALPKRVAFKDGKLLAFMATDGVDLDSIDEGESQLSEMFPDQYAEYEEWKETDEGQEEQASFHQWMEVNYSDIATEEEIKNRSSEQWWDRQDKSSSGIPLGNIPVPGDKFGRWSDFELVKGELKRVGGYEKRSGRKETFHIVEWQDNGYKLRETTYDSALQWAVDGTLLRYKGNDKEVTFKRPWREGDYLYVNKTTAKKLEDGTLYDGNVTKEEAEQIYRKYAQNT